MIRKISKKSKSRTPVTADFELGERIRARRIEVNMSQTELAVVLGVSFQQVQKYEKGVNRVNANRLGVIAEALKMRPEEFLQSKDRIPEVSSLIDVSSEDTLRMIRAYSRIKNQITQRQLVALIETIANAAS